MKLTVKQLRTIIKEEITRTLREGVANPVLQGVDASEDMTKNTSAFFDSMVRTYTEVGKNPKSVEVFNRILGEYPDPSWVDLNTVRNKMGYSHATALFADAVTLNKKFGIKVTSYDDVGEVVDANADSPEMVAARKVADDRSAQAAMVRDFEDRSPW